MKDFKYQLKQYLQGQTSFDQLIETVSALISRQPEVTTNIVTGLRQMAERQLLCENDLNALMLAIAMVEKL